MDQRSQRGGTDALGHQGEGVRRTAVYDLVGGTVRSRVKLYAHTLFGDQTPEAFAESAGETLNSGLRREDECGEQFNTGENMSDTVKVVLCGCGGMSGTWFKAAESFDDIHIVGVVDLFPEVAEGRNQEFGLSAVVGTDLASVIKETGAKAVFDVSVPDAHYGVTMSALNSDCHVLGEKPMADTMVHAREMRNTAQEKGLTYAVIQNRRYTKDIIAFRDLVQGGGIGDLTTVNTDFYIGAHFSAGRDKRDFRDSMPHVLILDMAIHSFDQARFVSGKDPVSVYCHEWNPKGSWYDYDASANCIFEMTDGVVYNYRGSWCAEGMNTTWECQWRVIGGKGGALWDGAAEVAAEVVERQETFMNEKKSMEITLPGEIPYAGHRGLIRDFIDHIKGDGPVPQTVCTDNIKSLAMVHGAIESAETRKKVPIEI